MSLSYIKRAEQGYRSALSFIATICLSIGGLVLGQSLLTAVIAVQASQKGEGMEAYNTGEKLLSYLPFPLTFSLLMMGFVCLILALWLCLKFIHRRKFSTLWSDEDRFRPKQFITGLLTSIILFAGAHFIGQAIAPNDYKWVLDPIKFYAFLPIALIFIPIQTCSEELFFRGYLYQAFGLASKNKWMAFLIASFIFGAFHFKNQEMDFGFWKMAIVYIGSGMMIGLSVLLSKGIEYGWGFHLINNLYLTLIVTFPGSSLDGPTLYAVPKPEANQILLEFGIQLIAYTSILLIVYRKNIKSLFKASA